MDISNKVSKDVRCSSKKAKASDVGKDFISDLPDEILVHILSFLPVKDAISTVLLRRFGNLWRCIKVLDFDDSSFHVYEEPDLRPYHDEGFVDLVRHVPNLHDNSVLDKLRLKFEFSTTCLKDMEFYDVNEDELEWEKDTSDQLEKLIRYAISRKVKVLDLSLKHFTPVFDSRVSCDLPDLLSSNYVTHLKLAAYNIMSCTTIDLKSLKVLLLDEVSLNDEIMGKVLIGCPFLEDLSLIDCYGLKTLFCKNPNLKKVMVTLTDENKVFFVLCPFVLSLEIYGCILRAWVFGAASVVDASISVLDANFRCEQKKYFSIYWNLREVSQCKTSNLCTSTILVFTIWNFTNVRCPSFEWKNLILKLSLTKWHHPGLSLLLRKSPSLETLTMHIYPSSSWPDKFFEKPEAKWIEAYEFDMDKFWASQEATFPSLKTIMIYGYVNEAYVIEMVKFLLRNATSLQKLIISTKKSFKRTRQESWYYDGPIERLQFQFTSDQLQELSDKFKSLPRASPDAIIYFS